jgi:hypothetical protein
VAEAGPQYRRQQPSQSQTQVRSQAVVEAEVEGLFMAVFRRLLAAEEEVVDLALQIAQEALLDTLKRRLMSPPLPVLPEQALPLARGAQAVMLKGMRIRA